MAHSDTDSEAGQYGDSQLPYIEDGPPEVNDNAAGHGGSHYTEVLVRGGRILTGSDDTVGAHTVLALAKDAANLALAKASKDALCHFGSIISHNSSTSATR